MNQSGAITDKAHELNEGRTTYEGGAVLAEAHEERRMLILACPSEKFLDEEHLKDCIDEVQTWAPNAIRQKMLRQMGGGIARALILQPDEKQAIITRWREARGK